MAIQGEKLALACAQVADDIKAENIRVLDVRGLSNLTDFLVICSAGSMPQMRAILRDISQRISEEHGAKPAYAESKTDARWVVLDYIDVMVHIMDPELREHYAIEDLWKDCKIIEGWQAQA